MDCFPELQILICEFSQTNLNQKRKSQKWDFLFNCPLRVLTNARENTARSIVISKTPRPPYRHFERKREIFFLSKRHTALLSSLRFDFSLFLPKAQVPCYNG